MEIIKTKLDKNVPIDKYLINKNPCFLDIETTGFNRSKDIIYLIGILSFDNKETSWILEQIFINKIEKEKELLLETIKVLSKFNVIINYNGDTFDIPFINQRLKIHNINNSISIEKSLDIYSNIRKNRYLFDLENLKLKTIEKFLGIHRKDIYSGKDCIQFYNDYLTNKDKKLKNKILQHNHDDLYYLLRVIKILDIIEMKKTFTIKMDTEDLSFLINDIKQLNDYIIINGEIKGNIENKTLFYKNNYKILISDNNLFEVSVEIKEGLVTPTKNCLFLNKHEFHMPDNIIWESDYNIPSNIILFKVENNFIISNIKSFISFLINKTLNN